MKYEKPELGTYWRMKTESGWIETEFVSISQERSKDIFGNEIDEKQTIYWFRMIRPSPGTVQGLEESLFHLGIKNKNIEEIETDTMHENDDARNSNSEDLAVFEEFLNSIDNWPF